MNHYENLKELSILLLAEEGITPEDLEMVDLDVAYSPVIPFRGGDVEDAVEVIRCEGGEKYLVCHSLCPHAVNKTVLTVMRYRYLISRNIKR